MKVGSALIAHLEGGTVIAREDYQRILRKTAVIERLDYAADCCIQTFDHRGVVGVVGFGRILLLEFPAKLRQILLRRFDEEVRIDKSERKEEGARAIRADELLGFGGEEVGTVTGDRNLIASPIEKFGKMLPGMTRVKIAERGVEALIEGMREAPVLQTPTMPLSDQRGRVAERFERLGERSLRLRQVDGVVADSMMQSVPAGQ